MLRKLYFKWTIASCDFAKQTHYEVTVFADVVFALPAAILQSDTDPWSQPRPTEGQAGPHSGGVRHAAG